MYKLIKLLSLLTTVFFGACGGDEEEAPSPVKMEPPVVAYRLHEETYQNQRYVFRVSNLPVDDWTVLEISNVARREVDKIWKEAWIAAAGGHVQFNAVDSFLLMQPTPEQNFAITILDAFEKQIPWIYIFIEKQKITEINSPREYEELVPVYDNIVASVEFRLH